MLLVDCGDPGLPENSERQGDQFLFTDTIQFTCNDGYYQSSGDNNLTCLNTGEWDGALPNCTGNNIPYMGKFGVGKYWQIESHLPNFTCQIILS